MGGREKGKLLGPKREKGKPVGPKREKGKGRTASFDIQFHLTTRPRVRTHERNETISRLSTPQPPIMYGSASGGGTAPPSYCCVGRQVHPPQPGFAWCCCGLGGEPPPAITQAWCCCGGAPPLGPHPSAAVATADQTLPDGLGKFPRFCRSNDLSSALLIWSPPIHPSLCFRLCT